MLMPISELKNNKKILICFSARKVHQNEYNASIKAFLNMKFQKNQQMQTLPTPFLF